MPHRLHRRHFLQLAGTTLAALGFSQFGLGRQAQQYSRALAQPARRKLALLVGINTYPEDIFSLRGCLTDVELQYELLVHRYGFNPRDILIVSDDDLVLPGQQIIAPPTRQNILEAFETHLIEQATPEDLVVFHYSGHGSFVLEDNGIPEFNGLNGTIVPFDGRIQAGNQVDDITGKTLFLLSSALPTEYVTLVLDCCYAGGGIRGNSVVRALDSPDAGPSERELDYQAQWMSRLNLDSATLLEQRRKGIAKGVALGSAQANQLASEVPFEGFHAGAFTYLLTRYLWQLPNQQPLSEAFVNLARSTRDVANSSGVPQDPIYATAPDQNWESSPIYLLDPISSPAEAVVRGVEGDQVSFWLGGLSANNLSAQQAVFNLVDARGNPIGEVLQTSRDGLIGRGILQTITQSPQLGQLMREQIRGVPANLVLRVGLAPSLANESADALALLNAIARIEGVPITQELPVDYLLGKLTDVMQSPEQPYSATASSTSGIGILTSDLISVPETFGAAEESVSQAIERLRPRLKMLLAGKMLSTLDNSHTSRLNVEIAILPVDNQTPLLSIGSRSAQETGLTHQAIANSVQLSVGTEVQVRVQNHERQELFISILTIASNGEMAILHPVVWDAPEEATRVSAGQTVQIPDATGGGDRFQFVAKGPAGFFELMVLASTEPLREALRSLQTIARGRRTRAGDPLAFTEQSRSANESEDAPVNVIDALLNDINRGARENATTINDSQRIDAQHLAAFSTVVEVID